MTVTATVTTSETEVEVGRLLNRFNPPSLYNWPFLDGTSDLVLYVLVSVSVLFSCSVCLDDI